MPVKIIPIYFYTPPPFFTNFTTWALGRLQQHTKIYCRIYVPCDGPSEKKPALQTHTSGYSTQSQDSESFVWGLSTKQ